MPKRLIMADVARLADVSVSTVSRALAGHPAIAAETRQRIARIAQEHGYVLDTQARNFRLQRSQTIAVVFPYLGTSKRMISDPFYMEMIGAITDELDPHGYDLIVSRVRADDDAWVQHYVMNRRVDGLILIDRAVEGKGIAKLQALNAPFVVWGPPVDDPPGVVSVGGDSRHGAALAVKHLVDRGRKRIGFIGGDAGMVETDMRFKGYKMGLQQCGLPFDARLAVFTDFTPQKGNRALTDLLQHAPDLDGLFICSDFMAIAIMEELRSMGRRVPDDIAVVGYDDIQLAAHCSPRLTTIDQQVYEGGRQMVRTLFAMIDGQDVDSIVQDVRLIVRDS